MCSLFPTILISFKAWPTKFANLLRINEKKGRNKTKNNHIQIENEPPKMKDFH